MNDVNENNSQLEEEIKEMPWYKLLLINLLEILIFILKGTMVILLFLALMEAEVDIYGGGADGKFGISFIINLVILGATICLKDLILQKAQYNNSDNNSNSISTGSVFTERDTDMKENTRNYILKLRKEACLERLKKDEEDEKQKIIENFGIEAAEMEISNNEENKNIYNQISELSNRYNYYSNFEEKEFNSKYLMDDDSIRKLIKSVKLDENNSLLESPPSLQISIVCSILSVITIVLLMGFDEENLMAIIMFLIFLIICVSSAVHSFQEYNIYKKDKINYILDGFYFIKNNFIICQNKRKFKLPKSELKNIFIINYNEGDKENKDLKHKMFIKTSEEQLIYLQLDNFEQITNLFNINNYDYKIIDFDYFNYHSLVE